MAKAEATVEELVGMIERGELRLPEMQRRYVWRSTRVRDLLDSLYRGYPSGAILLWETDEQVPQREFAVSQASNPFSSARLLLDGQQRLTSLSSVIRGEPVKVRGRSKPIDLLFNLDHPDDLAVITEVNELDDDDDELIDDEADSNIEELQQRFNKMTFVVATNRLEQMPQWVKVSEVFKTDEDAPFLGRAGVEKISDPRYQKYSKRLAQLRGIRKYVYRMDVLERKLSYGEVTEIFVRVNSLGAKLRGSDLALAQITARWRGSLKVFQEFQSCCEDRGFPVELGIHLRNLVVFATGQSRFKTVSSVPIDNLQGAWLEAVTGMEFAMNFLKSNIGIDSPALLSSPYMLITVGYYGHKKNYQFSTDEEARLRYWVLLANAKGRYSRGSSETLLDQDLTTLRQNGGPNELLERLRMQVGRLDITPDELEGRNQRSALFKTMFLAFRSAGAKDWNSNLAIALDHSGSEHRLQFHHIFPKATLKSIYSPREADDIANLAFIGGKTNRKISDKAPSVYFPTIAEKSGAGAFEAQCIPTQAELLDISSYKAFLLKRRELVAARLNGFLESIAPADVFINAPIPRTEESKTNPGPKHRYEPGLEISSVDSGGKSSSKEAIPMEAFLAFCKTCEGPELVTSHGGSKFTVRVFADALEYTPPTQIPRRETHAKIESVLARFAATNSLTTSDYSDVTRNSSYTLTLLQKYLSNCAGGA